MIIADDGGGQISFDGGETGPPTITEPTAQFYRVVTDNRFPYRIYGAQQDNSTVRILHPNRRQSHNRERLGGNSRRRERPYRAPPG